MKYFAAGFVLLGATFCHAADRYNILYQFDKGANDSNNQEAIRPILHGDTFYAATRGDGAGNKGTLFHMNKDSTGFAVLHKFVGGDADGHSPCGVLADDGDNLYGMTSHGGRGKGGVIFRMKPDGSDYTVLHCFSGGRADGATPYGSLAADTDGFYGMTFAGGAADKGIIFSIRKDGTGFIILRSFAGNGSEGSHPQGSVALHTETLYGVTRTGGRNETGVLFSLKPDGKQFTVLRQFADPSNHTVKDDGVEPYGSLTIHDNALYGMTRRGGKGGGVIFRYQLPTP